MSRLHALTAAVAATAAAAALAPSASAIPFGADLTRPANNVFGCEASGFIPNSPLAPPGQLFITPSGQTSCTWTSNGRLGDFAGTLSVPRSGRVTQVRIKAGPVTGPMQVVSFSTLNTFPVPTNRPPACCQIRGRSQVFTPAPNRITTVNVNLPVVTEKVPPAGQNIIRADGIGLSVLAPNVPVPAHNTGNYDALQGAPVGGVWYPAVAPGQERLSPAGLIGFQVLMRAELTPTGAAGGSTGGSGSAGGSGSSSSDRCAGRRATVVGTNRNDVLRGTRGRDVFVAKAGNDRILGFGGNDIACGGPGRDILLGGAGNDILLGQAGNDILRGQAGNDLLRGGAQNDRLFGQAGNDRLFGDAGRDLLAGASGNDRLDGGAGSRDRNLGGPGRDRCRRGAAVSC